MTEKSTPKLNLPLPSSKLADRFRNFQGLASLVNSPTASNSARRGMTSAFQSVSKAVSSPFVVEVGADAFKEYLNLVNPSWDAFVKARAESKRLATFEGKPVDFSEIPEVFLKSDYKVSGLLQHDILRQPLRRTVTYEERTHLELSTHLEKVEMMLISHLANFDALIQSLESMSLLEQGIFSASEKIKSARERIKKVKESKDQVKLHSLLRRKKRILQTLEILDKIGRIRETEKNIQSNEDLPAAVALTAETLKIVKDEFEGISSLKQIYENLNIHAAGLDKFIENDFVEIVGKALIPSELETEEFPGDKISKMIPALDARSLTAACMQNSLRDALLKRAKLRFKKFTAHFLAQAVGDFEDEAVAMQQLPSEKFPGFWISLVNAGVSTVLENFSIFGKILAMSSEKKTGESLQRIVMEISSTLTGRAAVLLQGRTLSLSETTALACAAEPYLRRNFQAADNLARVLSIPLAPPSAAGVGLLGNIESEISRKLKSGIEEFSLLRNSEIKMALERERWEAPKSALENFAEISAAVKLLIGESAEDVSADFAKKGIKIGRSNFLAIPAAIEAILILKTFFDLWKQLPLIGPDILEHTGNFLRSFDAEMRDLILQGRAATLGGRQSVTATNLALAAQTCGIFAALLPLLANNFMKISAENFSFYAQLAGTSETANALEDLKFSLAQEFADHREDLFTKLSDILVERFEVQSVQWFTEEKQESALKLAKDFSAMYRVLLKALAPADSKKIFSRAFNSVSERFAGKLKEISMSLNPGKQRDLSNRLHADFLFFFEALTGK